MNLCLVNNNVSPVTHLFRLVLPVAMVVFLVIVDVDVKVFRLSGLHPMLNSKVAPVVGKIDAAIITFLKVRVVLVVITIVSGPTRTIGMILVNAKASVYFCLVAIIVIVKKLSISNILAGA